jgi:hypothetical protein
MRIAVIPDFLSDHFSPLVEYAKFFWLACRWALFLCVGEAAETLACHWGASLDSSVIEARKNVMSSISGLGSSVYQFLVSGKGKHKASKTGSAVNVNPAQDSDGDGDGSTPGIQGNQLGGSGNGSFIGQIQAAVSSALQSAQSGGSAANPNQLIQNAIAQIFKNQQNIVGGTTSQNSGSDGDSDTDTPGVADQDGSSFQSVFANLLQSNGINSQQFQQSFLTAINSAQNGGSTNVGSVLSSLPPGSLIDTLA